MIITVFFCTADFPDAVADTATELRARVVSVTVTGLLLFCDKLCDLTALLGSTFLAEMVAQGVVTTLLV